MPALILATMQQYQELANEYEHPVSSSNVRRSVMAAKHSGSLQRWLFIMCTYSLAKTLNSEYAREGLPTGRP